MNIRKKGSGGKRAGAGGKKPQKYGEKTTTIAFRVPMSKKDQIKEYVNKKLSKWAASHKKKKVKK